jgi:hypothetical protein
MMKDYTCSNFQSDCNLYQELLEVLKPEMGAETR